MIQGTNETRIKEMIDAAGGISDSVERSRKYKNIVGLLAQETIRSNDLRYIEDAKKIAGLVTDDPSKAFVEIIRAIAKMKRKNKHSFDKALTIIKCLDNELDVSVGLYEIALGFARYGINEKDDIIYSDALNLVKKIPLPTYQAMAYRNISNVLSEVDRRKSLELLNVSIDILKSSEGIKPKYQIFSYCETGASLAKHEDMRSYGFLSKAIPLVDNIQDHFEKSAVLLKILETQIQIGKKFNDNTLFDEAAVISGGITKEYYKTLALKELEKCGVH